MLTDLNEIQKKKVLLVYPDFPIPKKRKIHHDFLPIGLLKIGTYLRDHNSCEVRLLFGNSSNGFEPDFVLITSLFTYWSDYVHQSVSYYREMFPEAKIIVGGIYATLLPDVVEKATGAEVFHGTCERAEEWCRNKGIDYSFLPSEVDFEIIHGMRGCFRKCGFCGTWKLEPNEQYFDNFKFNKNHVVFYDNNFLKHPNVAKILKDFEQLRVNGRVVTFESQSGFDGRILNKELATLIKKARFINPRIAWDHSIEDFAKIKKQVGFLQDAGYHAKEISVFMIFNWELDYDQMEKKREKCWELGVQITDCRYRPLTQLFDRFNARITQTTDDYFIAENWTDAEVKQFRKNVRKHNICIRHGFPFHSPTLEHMRVSKAEYQQLMKSKTKSAIRKKLPDAWFPDECTIINK